MFAAHLSRLLAELLSTGRKRTPERRVLIMPMVPSIHLTSGVRDGRTNLYGFRPQPVALV